MPLKFWIWVNPLPPGKMSKSKQKKVPLQFGFGFDPPPPFWIMSKYEQIGFWSGFPNSSFVKIFLLRCHVQRYRNGASSQKTRRGSPADGRTSTAEAPPIGKIHPLGKIAVTLEPVMRFGCPLRSIIPKKYVI